MDRMRELKDEFNQVVLARAGVFDTLLPPLIFVLARLFIGFTAAVAAAAGLAVIVGVLRLRRRQPLWFALGGSAGVLTAAFLSRSTGGERGYYLPGMLSGVGTALLCLVSVFTRRPLVAWTSHFARRWPRGWYWHPKVRPAYAEVTLAWGLYFGLRTAVQAALYLQDSPRLLAVMNTALGWPGTIVLLAASYLYGRWRLLRLGGPGVDEWEQDTPPPWRGQLRGF